MTPARTVPWWPAARAWRAAVGLALLVLACGPAWAQPQFPALTGRVVDAARILDAATRARLDAALAAQEEKASDQFVVATVPSLDGTSAEDYANRLFRAWRLGEEKKNNGVLLLVAPNERKVRIEVGYGLEGILTDAVASAIIRNAVIPDFRAGNMSAGVEKGAQAVIEILNLDPEEARVRARRAEEPDPTAQDWVSLIVVVVLILFWIYVFWRASRGGGPGAGGGGGLRSRRRDGMAGGPVTTWDWGRGGGGRSRGGWSGRGGSSGGGGASGSW